MTVLRQTFIFCLVLLLSLCSLATGVYSKELVGILPFTNQRTNQEFDWFGFYLQAGIQSYLERGCNCDFNTLSTLRLWKFNAGPDKPVTSKNTHLIDGSYQQVLDYGYIEIRLIDYSQPEKGRTLDFSFTDDSLESKLEERLLEIGQWISPAFTQDKEFEFPGYNEGHAKDLFRFRMELFDKSNQFEIKDLFRIQKLISATAHPEFISDFAEGALIISSDLPSSEKDLLLEEIETLLREAAMKHVNHSRIHALLAETFYLRKKFPSWIQATAEQAVKQNPQNDLAHLLLIMTSDASGDGIKDEIRQLDLVNPWIWPNETDAAQFQKGIFNLELSSIGKAIH